MVVHIYSGSIILLGTRLSVFSFGTELQNPRTCSHIHRCSNYFNGDCVIFVLSRRLTDVHILSFDNTRGRTWNEIYTTDPIDEEARELAYMGRTLFCIFRWGSLIGAFNVALQVWDMMDCSTIPINNTSNRSWEFYLVEVSYGKVYLIAEETHDSWHAFDYNGSNKKWVQIESFREMFKNQAVFLECPSSVAPEVPQEVEFGRQFAESRVITSRLLRRRFEAFLLDDFKTNCTPGCDIIMDWVYNKYLKSTLIQLIPETDRDHGDANDDTKFLSLPVLPDHLIYETDEDGEGEYEDGVVCKTWEEDFLDGVVQGCLENHMPWVMNYGCFKHKREMFSILELSDLVAKRTYSVGNSIKKEVRELFVETKVRASKYGRLLLSKKGKSRKYGSLTTFIFYNPFRNKIIQLSSPLENWS